MSDNRYVRQVHTCAFHPKLGVPLAILHAPGDKVWLQITYADELQPTWLKVGDGSNNGYDEDGCCIISIPQSECSFMDDEEAESVMACIDADERLLSYAL